MQGMARSGDGLRGLILSLGRNTALYLWGAGSVAVFLTIFVMSIVQSPSLGGALRGIGAGVIVALFFAAGIGWTLLWAFGSPRQAVPDNPTAVGALESLLAPVLSELNTVRREVMRQVKERSKTRVPLAAAAALSLWVLAEYSDDPPGLLMLPVWVVFGALAGEAWAAHGLDKDYRRLYKSRVLPQLAARLGDLTYQDASADAVNRLQAYRVFGGIQGGRVEDEITGTYRGLPISIVEARLERSSGENTTIVFDGLLIQLTLPRTLTSTTAVIPDQGTIGNLKAQWRAGQLERIRLENPHFEKHYEVFGTDQIEARALLTPAFMERFMGLAERSGYSLPGAIAEANRLLLALPKSDGRDLFEPPVYWKPAGGRALLELNQDIAAVLRMADAVIALDFFASGSTAAIPHPSGGPGGSG
jgi:Protein of unknown function (DUF3137)